MRIFTLLARNLRWYWRTNLAVLLGVATATGVLGGALAVGESVRASLRDLVLSRLGNVDSILTRDGFFREQLGDVPIIALEGVAAHEPSGRRASNIQIYGVDERFWRFQNESGDPPRGREILLSAALAQELAAKPEDTILLRVQKPSAIPLESLHGRKEDAGKTMRLLMSGVARHDFSLRAQQGDVRAVYVDLARLQRELAQPGRANTLLVGFASRPVQPRYTLEDFGLKLRPLEDPPSLSLESDSAVINDVLAETASRVAQAQGLSSEPVLTYLANSMKAGARETPYSLVTALDSELAPADDDGITLNDWAARDLAAKPGDSLTLEYYVWQSSGHIETATAQFRVSRIIPIRGRAADRKLAPDYPGITESDTLQDWDPPFPMDLKRVRPIDEEYWKLYRTTPKAFIPLKRGQQLWGTRYGSLTSIRLLPPSPTLENALLAAIDPAKMGLRIIPVRAEGLAASRGATDFGEYFLYFSFFVMVSALLLTGLFFKLGIEQRLREIGVLRALGFSASKIRSVFLLEGALLATLGAALGVGVSLGYGAFILYGLRTWWVDAVGTRLLTLHASIPMLAAGAAAGVITGLGAIAWTLRRQQAVTPRGLVAGEQKTGGWRSRAAAFSPAAVMAALLAIGIGGWDPLESTCRHASLSIL